MRTMWLFNHSYHGTVAEPNCSATSALLQSVNNTFIPGMFFWITVTFAGTSQQSMLILFSTACSGVKTYRQTDTLIFLIILCGFKKDFPPQHRASITQSYAYQTAHTQINLCLCHCGLMGNWWLWLPEFLT